MPSFPPDALLVVAVLIVVSAGVSTTAGETFLSQVRINHPKATPIVIIIITIVSEQSGIGYVIQPTWGFQLPPISHLFLLVGQRDG